MTLHIASVHEGKKHKCEVCAYRCYDIGNINRHIIAVYKSETAYKCDICDATFATKSSMKAILKFMKERRLVHAIFVSTVTLKNLT